MIVTGESEFERRPVFKVVNIETEQTRMGNDMFVRPLRELTAKKHARELLLDVVDGLLCGLVWVWVALLFGSLQGA